MTETRREEICTVISKDQEKAKKLLAMTPEEVAATLKSEGYDFTVDEIKELGVEIQEQIDSLKGGELGENDLENVSGGNHMLSFAGGMATVGIAAGLILCGW